MKKSSFSLFAIAMAMCVSLVSCDKTEKIEFVSEVGSWELSGVEYYYDGQKLNYESNEIGVWVSSSEQDLSFFVSNGGYSFNENGTGLAYGLGESESDEYAYTYSRTGDKLNLRIPMNGKQKNRELSMEKGRLVMVEVKSDIYGWSRSNSHDIMGNDGNSTHKLEIRDIYTRKK